MADISKIKVDDIEYNVKDVVARQELEIRPTAIGNFNVLTQDLNELLTLPYPAVYIHRFNSDVANNPTNSSGFVLTYLHNGSVGVQYSFHLNGSTYKRQKYASDTIAEWTALN